MPINLRTKAAKHNKAYQRNAQQAVHGRAPVIIESNELYFTRGIKAVAVITDNAVEVNYDFATNNAFK